MINIKNSEIGLFEIEYNTDNGVKYDIIECEPLKVIKSDDGEFRDLHNNLYTISKKRNDKLAYHCLNINTKNNKTFFNYYLNVVLQLEDSFFSELKPPKLLFYDIKTDNKDKDIAKITSITWVGLDNREHCIVNGIDGSEKEIIEEFVNYCKNNKIMGLVGHNTFNFYNEIIINRCKEYEINNSIFYNDCNLDTMVLSRFLQYTSDECVSLNDLAELVDINDNKVSSVIYNPLNLYKEALNDNTKLELFEKYNIQDVKLIKECFNGMNSLPQLNDIFTLTKCPFNKIHYNTTLLNNFTCNYLYKRKIIVPETVNTPVKFKNEGGYNHYNENNNLLTYNNILVVDIDSYYPHLLMYINADPSYEYSNINCNTGEIKPFKQQNNIGTLGELTKELYESRIESKLEMKKEKDPELRKQLNCEQLTKKIIVNSLYGVLNQKNGQYILKNDLIPTIITKIGREVLKHITKKFKGVYAKTDSVFIPLTEKDNPEIVLNAINIEVSNFLLDEYKLSNIRDGSQLVRFEIDSVLDKLIVKDKNNYVKKYKNGMYEFKGGSFKSSTFSKFENDTINEVIKLVDEGKSNKDILNHTIENTETILNNNYDLQYFEKPTKLSKKQKNHTKIKNGIKYMEDLNLSYDWCFKYQYCIVESNVYKDIMYPKRHIPEFDIKHSYVFELLFSLLNNIKIINNDEKKSLIKKYKNTHNNRSNSDNSENHNKKNIEKTENKNDIFIKQENKENENLIYKNSSYNKLKNKIGNKINELTIVKFHNDKKYPMQNWGNIKKTNLESLENHNGNIGIIFNPENKYKYGFIDIDGFKELGEDINKEFKCDLYKIFENNKNIINYSVVQKTQSNGFHLIFKHQENTEIGNKFINQFKIPKELKNKYKINKECLGDGSKSGIIEIFINLKKSCTFYPSEYKDHESGKTKKYDIIHVGDKFGEPIKNIKKELENCFGKIKTPQEPKRNIKVNNNYNIESFKNDNNVFNLMVEEFKEQEGNHNYILGIYTSILLYVGLNKSEVIEYMLKIFNKAGDNTKEHGKQIESYIDGNDGRYPKYKDLNNNKLKKTLDGYLKFNKNGYKTDIKTTIPFLNITTNNKWNFKKDKEVLELLKSLPTDVNLNENDKEDMEIFEEIEKVKYTINNSDDLKDKKTAVEKLQEKIKINENNLIDKYIKRANTNNAEKIQILAEILGDRLNVVRRENIGDTYILDKKTNSYIKITNDELLHKITTYIGKKYIISDDDIKKSITYISKRIKPSFNYIRFNNCIMDMDIVEKIKPNEPILCLLNIPYDYNPNAKSDLVDDYLESSLKDTNNETTNKKIQGLYEILGYLLTSGNKEEILFIVVGKKGGGKSVLGQIITALVGGTQNTCDVKLDKLTSNPHNTSPFINAHLNIIQEQDKKYIKNTGVIKQITGNDGIMVNPKNKDLVQLKPEEVPKTVIMCNNPPDLTEDGALIDRIVLLHFKNSFRNTKKQDKDLAKKIINNKEAMEYILFNSLEAYKTIVQNSEKELTLRVDEKTRIELLEKNNNPFRYCIEKLVEIDEDYDIFEFDNNNPYNVSSLELKQLIKKIADKEGLEIPIGKDGLPKLQPKRILDKIYDKDKDYFKTKLTKKNGKPLKYYNHLKYKEYGYKLKDD